MRNVSLIVEHIDASRYEVFVVALQGRNDSGNELTVESKDVSFRKIPDRGKFDLQCLRTLAKCIRQHDIQIVSCHGYKADVYGFLLKYLFRLPIRLLTIAHGWIPSGVKMRFYYFIDKCVMRGFDKVVLVSGAQWRELGRFGMCREKVTIIPNAVHPKLLDVSVDRSAARGALGVEEDEVVIGGVGRFSKEKAFATTITAVDELATQGHDVTLLLCGDGPERVALEQMVERIGGRVIFTGFRSDVEQVYSALDLFLSTSVTEGLPNTLLEAQAIGLPCIVSDIAGNNDVVIDGENGLLYPLGDISALVACVIRLLEQPELRDTVARGAKERVREHFSMTQRIARLQQEYDNLLKS